MRLLLICHEFPPVGGGGGRAAHALARCFGDEHEVTVVTARGPWPALRDGRYDVVEVGPRRRDVAGASPREMAAFTLAAARAAGRRPADACIAVQAVPAAFVGWWLKRRHGIPYVIRLVGADVPGFLPERYGRVAWIMRRTSALTWPQARAVVANSPGLRDLAQRTAGGLGVSADVIPNGVDADFFRPGAAAARTGPLRFVFVGRLVRQKGLHELIAALRLERVRLEGQVRLEIVGEGEEAATIRAAVTRHDLAELVTLSAWLPRDGVVRCLQAADAFVVPSLDEGMPNALLEAMACGLPAIGTTVPGTVDLLEDGVNGWLVPPRDPAALGKALVDAVTAGRERLREMGAIGRQRAERSPWRRTADAYLARLTAAPERWPA